MMSGMLYQLWCLTLDGPECELIRIGSLARIAWDPLGPITLNTEQNLVSSIFCAARRGAQWLVRCETRLHD